jgi:hypothetical protein
MKKTLDIEYLYGDVFYYNESLDFLNIDCVSEFPENKSENTIEFYRKIKIIL